jgi:hypothetical protein
MRDFGVVRASRQRGDETVVVWGTATAGGAVRDEMGAVGSQGQLPTCEGAWSRGQVVLGGATKLALRWRDDDGDGVI